MAKSSGLTIGALAKSAAVNTETIRYYQRRGLIATPKKALGGIRRYPTDAAQRIRFIKRAQTLGFTLEEIATLLELNDGTNCASTRLLAEHKLEEIEARIADIESIRDALKNLITACRNKTSQRCCPIIETLGIETPAENEAR